jgi:hypothetical protein
VPGGLDRRNRSVKVLEVVTCLLVDFDGGPECSLGYPYRGVSAEAIDDLAEPLGASNQSAKVSEQSYLQLIRDRSIGIRAEVPVGCCLDDEAGIMQLAGANEHLRRIKEECLLTREVRRQVREKFRHEM